ncbi:hypothetical protein [Mycobacterium malmoense]|uniref:hypothetical protein n=1 Tax=Mycobacterium malmoense TaxID=1780 RepID=UPI001146B43C|nr:hypothetical protein [Mycobacterium malmoense]
MPNRSLVAAATIVWSVAVLVALLFGLPTLLTMAGVHVDAGLIVNALSAIGAFSAAAVALWVATSDRRERQHERDAQDEAQAKLVIIAAECQQNPVELQIRVVNNSPRAIVDLTFVRIVVEGHNFDDLRPTTGPFPPVAGPGSFSAYFFNPVAAAYGPAHPYFIAIRGGPNGEARTITSSTRVTATVRWTDASGKTWERWGAGPWLTGASTALGANIELGKPVRVFGQD